MSAFTLRMVVCRPVLNEFAKPAISGKSIGAGVGVGAGAGDDSISNGRIAQTFESMERENKKNEHFIYMLRRMYYVHNIGLQPATF